MTQVSLRDEHDIGIIRQSGFHLQLHKVPRQAAVSQKKKEHSRLSDEFWELMNIIERVYIRKIRIVGNSDSNAS